MVDRVLAPEAVIEKHGGTEEIFHPLDLDSRSAVK